MEHEKEPLTTGEKVGIVLIIAISGVAMLAAWMGLMDYLNNKLPHIGIMDLMSKLPPSPPVPPGIELTSMDFTLHNITQTRLSAKWDLSIRIPYYLPDSYVCLNGDLQVALLYKKVTIATSSPQKYNNLRYRSAQLLKVSAVVSEKIYQWIDWERHNGRCQREEASAFQFAGFSYGLQRKYARSYGF